MHWFMLAYVWKEKQIITSFFKVTTYLGPEPSLGVKYCSIIWQFFLKYHEIVFCLIPLKKLKLNYAKCMPPNEGPEETWRYLVLELK